MAKQIDKALYKQKNGQPLTRKEQKAIAQHKSAPRKRVGFSSYKANRSVRITAFAVDHVNDVLVATETQPITPTYTND